MMIEDVLNVVVITLISPIVLVIFATACVEFVYDKMSKEGRK